MQIINCPTLAQQKQLLQRPLMDHTALINSVQAILDRVKQEGDRALIELTERFDKVVLSDGLLVDARQIKEGVRKVDPQLRAAIDVAICNIKKFHASQKIKPKKITTTSGVVCWQKSIGIERVGLYIPGGSAPLFSTVLMLAIPAKLAGCKQIILCTPPSSDGTIHPAILYAAKKTGVDAIYKVGGAQAIAAMSYGTESIPKVYKIFGPGNQYVMAAKQLVSYSQVAIDMPAGPSEVEVLADRTANPAFIAADLLSQAEHGADSQSILITDSLLLAQAVEKQVQCQLPLLARSSVATRSLMSAKLIVLPTMQEAIEWTNAYAPEHLIIQTQDANAVADRIVNAGSVFIGAYTPESAGDYASGTNHTLPTNGYALSYNGVNLDSFVRKITFQEISDIGLRKLGPVIEIMAESEHLDAHKNAVTIRLNSL